MIQLDIINDTIKFMFKLIKRQLDILEFIRKNNGAGNREIRAQLEKQLGEISRITVVRDLDQLAAAGMIKKEGKGRNLRYAEKLASKLLIYFDPEKYFAKGPDERNVEFERFNFDVFKEFKKLFNDEELKELTELNKEYSTRIKSLSPAQIKKEVERLTIELSWKSSRIEGNTYTLIDTEILIKENKEAKGHKKTEAIMILNHKKALDYIFKHRNEFKKLNLRKIENIHRLIVENLGVEHGLRKKPVGIVSAKYKPLDNIYQIREAAEDMINTVNKLKSPLAKALAAILLTAYIQPFEDGNKRTSRLLGNAILAAHSFCPLSYRSINEADYKKAAILFYEQNSAGFFKKLFIEQFRFSIENYFLA